MPCKNCEHWRNNNVKPPASEDNRYIGDCRRYPTHIKTIEDHTCGEWLIDREVFKKRILDME